MGYTSIHELPESVRKSLSKEDCQIWMDSYNTISTSPDVEIPAFWEGYEACYFRKMAWECCTRLPSSRYVKARATSDTIDNDREVMDIHAHMEEGKYLIWEGGTVIDGHTNKVSGTVWNIYTEFDPKTGEESIVAEINIFRGKDNYNKLWNAIRRGNLQWSMGVRVDKARKECDKRGCYLRVFPEHWYELSVVYRGVNPHTETICVLDGGASLDGGLGKPDVLKGDMGALIDFNVNEDSPCPMKQRYFDFKDDMQEQFPELTVHGMEGGAILIYGNISDEARIYISREYNDFSMNECNGVNDGESAIIITKPQEIGNPDEILDKIMFLLKDEQEAIAGYNAVMNFLIQEGNLDEEQRVALEAMFGEVIHDEENHIGVVLEAVKSILPDLYSAIQEGVQEAKDVTKGCPNGQHDHYGVSGCHDVFRKHGMDKRIMPEGKMDLTDEQIDTNAIFNMSTENLKALILKVTNIISKLSESDRDEFFASSSGKEFVMLFLEYKRRKSADKEKGVEMNAVENIVSPETSEDVLKGEGVDILGSLASIVSVVSVLKAQIDAIGLDLKSVKASLSSLSGGKADITDAILSEMGSGAGGTEGIEEIIPSVEPGVVPETAVEEVPPQLAEGKAEEVPPETKSEEKEKEEVAEEKPAEGDSESEPPNTESEESKEEDKPEEKPKDDEKTEDASEKKEESKETESKEAESDEDPDKKKGSEGEVTDVGASNGESLQEPDAKADGMGVSQSVSENPASAGVGDSIATADSKVDSVQGNLSNGGKMDTWQTRVDDLKAKGVELPTSESGGVSITDQQTIQVIGKYDSIPPSGTVPGDVFDANPGKRASVRDQLGRIPSREFVNRYLEELRN